MFEDSFVESRSSRSAKKRAMLVVSIVVHVCMVSVLVLIPLFQLQVLPQIHADPPLPPFHMPLGAVRVVNIAGSRSGASHVPTVIRNLTSPLAMPSTTPSISDIGQPDLDSTNGIGLPSKEDGPGSPFGFTVDPPSFIPPPPERPAPPPMPPPPPPPPQPVNRPPQRVSGGVQQANLLEHPTPIYPKLAIVTRVQGAVILEAVITREGNVDSVRVISGHPLLTEAAVDAVRRWRYRPTLLNGQPIEVITTVTVNFSLQ